MELGTLILGAAVALWVAVTLARNSRVVGENERIVVSRLGKFHAILLPGFHISVPGSSDTFTRVTLGDLGSYQGDGLAKVSGAVFPSESGALAPQDPIQVTSFRDEKIWVAKAAVRIVTCEKCGHENRVSA